MKRFVRVAAVCLMGLAALPAAAQAPAQTKENAKKFLSMALAGARYNKNNFSFRGRELDLYTSNDKWAGALGAMQADSDGCVLKFSFSAASFSHREYISNGRYSDWTDYDPDYNPVYLDFVLISNVAQSGTRIDFSVQGKSRRRAIFLTSEDMATRVAYAMNFLMQQCNPINATGF